MKMEEEARHRIKQRFAGYAKELGFTQRFLAMKDTTHIEQKLVEESKRANGIRLVAHYRNSYDRSWWLGLELSQW